jgi:hypothetical protein
MVKDSDLDLEVLEAGVAYTLYAATLVNLAITFNKRDDAELAKQDVAKHAKVLNESLARCGVDKSIPVDVGDANKILRFLQGGELIQEISNLLVRYHSRRQELIFLLTSVMGGVLTGSIGGVTAATKPAQTQAMVIGSELHVPESVIIQCFDTKTINPLREFIRDIHWSDMVEAKPSFLGFAVDLKKLFAVIWKWFIKKR